MPGFCRSRCVCCCEKYSLQRRALAGEIDAFTGQLTSTTQMEDIKHQPVIFATREAYKRCGKDPGRYRPSANSTPPPDAWNPFISD